MAMEDLQAEEGKGPAMIRKIDINLKYRVEIG
jgi:hypothetical protein